MSQTTESGNKVGYPVCMHTANTGGTGSDQARVFGRPVTDHGLAEILLETCCASSLQPFRITLVISMCNRRMCGIRNKLVMARMGLHS